MSEIRRLIPRSRAVDARKSVGRLATASIAMSAVGSLAVGCDGGNADQRADRATFHDVAVDLCNYYASCDPDYFAENYASTAECVADLAGYFDEAAGLFEVAGGQACIDAMLDYYRCYYDAPDGVCVEPSSSGRCDAEGAAMSDACSNPLGLGDQIEAVATHHCATYAECEPTWFADSFASQAECIRERGSEIAEEIAYYTHAYGGEACGRAIFALVECEEAGYGVPDCYAYARPPCDAENAAVETDCDASVFFSLVKSRGLDRGAEPHRPAWLRRGAR